MKSFSNHFIISMPHMNDPIFSKSLIYICEHDDDGAMGLIINKPMISENASDIIQQTGLTQIEPLPDIYFGGPVNLEMGLILHDANYNIEGTLTISKSVALTSNKQIVLDLKNGGGPDEFRFSFGYAGWGKGQIEREIENGDWLLMPADDDFIFSIPNTDKWKKAASKFGIDILDLGGSAGLA
jgi:putative transcriptional regulator|tara:strand:- start:472 stop:1020 length:549 start_codon:yes stop_codon:yes gene_type:complete